MSKVTPLNVFKMTTPQKSSEKTVFKQACSQALLTMMGTASQNEMMADHVGDVIRHTLPSHLLMMGYACVESGPTPCSSSTFYPEVHRVPLQCSFCQSRTIESIGHVSFSNQFTARCIHHSTRKTTL